ncbi:MAG: OmpA family protein [candidate division Zixibacteria bacterium]|jgi:outer membrane protein OmpA-like peptidoglycan-associated protein|nr:OmpA family protein [candidate division Zixibacteria bacterium]
MKKWINLGIAAVIIIGLIGCGNFRKREQGAIIGAAAGGALGGLIGHEAGNTAVGAILGAAVGGAAGAYIGNYMDKQADEMKADLEGAKIERIGEGIKITFDSGILFDVNKSTLQPQAMANLQKLAVILNKYPDTEILVEGHTDNTGSDEYNMDLSLRRAQSVSNYLASLQVLQTRIHTNGYGESQPIATNETPEGRQLNRRVEVAIYANEKLKKAAEKQG